MMKVIFEAETEIGKCDYEPAEPREDRFGSTEPATLFAHTEATLNGQKGMLKVEHHCYLRQGENIPEQPWIRPEIILEPALESKDAMIDFARDMHERFVSRVRAHFPEELLR